MRMIDIALDASVKSNQVVLLGGCRAEPAD
jgi:hypothetical protein